MIERIAGVAAIVVVAVGIVLAFLLIGPPGHSRLLAMDRHRANDIAMISGVIAAYGEDEKKPPAGLAVIARYFPETKGPSDPQTGQPYEYRVLSAKRYMLCATFALPQERHDGYYDGNTWFHGAGHTCYTITFPGGRIVGTSH